MQPGGDELDNNKIYDRCVANMTGEKEGKNY